MSTLATLNDCFTCPHREPNVYSLLKINCLLLLFCCLSMIMTAQNPAVKFGTVTQDELTMNYVTGDSSAEAVVLYEKADIEFAYNEIAGFRIIYSYHGRYKILKKSGLDRGIIKIPFYRKVNDTREDVLNIEGFTYNLENGKIVSSKLSKANIFYEKGDGATDQKKISMPDLKEGAVFEYRYVKETPFRIKNKPGTWYFQSDIPINWSEITVVIPAYFNYRIIRKGYLPFFINERKEEEVTTRPGQSVNGLRYRLVVKDAPAFHNETFIASAKDYISKIDFELTGVSFPNSRDEDYTGTWDQLAETLLKSNHFGETFKKTSFLNEAIKRIAPIEDTLQKIKMAFEYVSKTVAWSGEHHVRAYANSHDVFANKKGDATEINLILVALLKELGLDADPVIISTRENGTVNELYPMLNEFNYTIANVTLRGKNILMDATDPLTKPGMLPVRCLNGVGRLLKEKGSRFVSLDPTEKKGLAEMMEISLDIPAGQISGNITIANRPYTSYQLRAQLKEKGEDDFIKTIKKDRPEWEIKNIKIEGADDLSQSFNMEYDFSYPEDFNTGKIYINPMLSGKISDNPFKETQRIYPVDLIMSSDKIFVLTINIPEGYVVETLPKSVAYALPENAAKFSYAITEENNSIKLTSRIAINRFYFKPEEYKGLKEFYDQIIQKHAEQIVLKKK